MAIAELRRNAGGFAWIGMELDVTGRRNWPDLDVTVNAAQSIEFAAPLRHDNALLMTIERELGTTSAASRFWPTWYEFSADSGHAQVTPLESWKGIRSLWPYPSIVPEADGYSLFAPAISEQRDGASLPAAPNWIFCKEDGTFSIFRAVFEEPLPRSHQFAFIRTSQGHLVSIFVCDWRSLHGAVINENGAFSKPAVLFKQAPPETEISKPRLFATREGLTVLWRQYNGKKKRATRISSLFMLRLSESLIPLGPPEQVTEEREIVHWVATRHDNGIAVVWSSGISQSNRAVAGTFITGDKSVALPKQPANIHPDILISVGRQLLCLSHAFAKNPYEWRLETQQVNCGGSL